MTCRRARTKPSAAARRLSCHLTAAAVAVAGVLGAAFALPACVSGGAPVTDTATGGAGAAGTGGATTLSTGGGRGAGAPGSGGTGSPGTPAPPASGTGGGAAASPAGSAFPAVSSFEAPGPYKTMTINSTGPGGTFTLYRPSELGQGGVRHPIITWGNGTGTTPAIYSAFLTHLASHGFVVIASNNSNTGSGAEMLSGVQWLIEQNTGTGEFAGKLDTTKVGATGHSQGGGGALNAGADPRVTTVVPIAPAPGSGTLKGTMALLCGGQDTIISATTLCTSLIYNRATVPTFFGILKAATHTTAIGNIGGYRGPATAWMRLQLMGDETARAMFYGSSCTLCADPSWTVTSKNL